MSRKRTTYSADFKAKVVLELLEGDNTLNEIASKYNLLPKNLQNWKKQFLNNASLAFDKSIVVKEYKEEIEKLKKEKDATSKKLGEVIPNHKTITTPYIHSNFLQYNHNHKVV